MGITGLLPLLKPVTKETHVRELKGLTVGIDTYCWLHKGIYGCSSELCQGIPTDKFIKYCVERIHLLLGYGVRPYLVFDGGYLPAKASKEDERRERRQLNMQRGRQLLREGNPSAAHQFFCKAADVTPFMAHQLIQVIKRIPGVRYVVAPYEADAQLGLLARNRHVDAVITEDSDILLFGCTRVVFKLDRDGTGQEVDLREVFRCRNDELDMRGMDENDLMTLCALSGCDYLPSVHGIGLKKAHRLVARHKERAFDPVTRTVVHMTPLPENLSKALRAPCGGVEGRNSSDALDFLGPPVPEERGRAVAGGDVDPITGERFSDTAYSGGEDGNTGKRGLMALSESAAAALASWRGASTSASRSASGGRGTKTKLSANGNNLTKYWGIPSSSKKRPSIPSSTAGDAVGTERPHRSVSGDRDVQEISAPECPGTDRRVMNEAGRSSGVAGGLYTSEGGIPARPHIGGQMTAACAASPASDPSYVSPTSFYDSVPSPSSAGVVGGDENEAPGREEGEPLLFHDPLESKLCRAQVGAKSKHFGSDDFRSGRAATVASAPSGLRRRFRRPPAGAGWSASGAPCASEHRGAGVRGNGDAGVFDPRDPFASLDVNAINGAGSSLKRRRTLGARAVGSNSLVCGLSGAAVSSREIGERGLLPRSKSFGGISRGPSIREAASGCCVHARNSRSSDHSLQAKNLFERFAARPTSREESVRAASDDDGAESRDALTARDAKTSALCSLSCKPLREDSYPMTIAGENNAGVGNSAYHVVHGSTRDDRGCSRACAREGAVAVAEELTSVRGDQKRSPRPFNASSSNGRDACREEGGRLCFGKQARRAPSAAASAEGHLNDGDFRGQDGGIRGGENMRPWEDKVAGSGGGASAGHLSVREGVASVLPRGGMCADALFAQFAYVAE